ncbi:sulfite exporter TauE/SafE family protein [Campylobacter geochelonis]|uniref:sulfite exporter TauE/SafE family protein n=1 Tax=Campylobacter geochelonis TaxID=1780362 RepID=UPI0007708966|nr:sulfite exporter TauE/SafE family protein [Campylobacter geochelonis]CZE48970.1 integral membrane protein [Campylobacter geochelonis]
MSLCQTALNIVPMAFFVSFGHCLGMCGGFVMAYSVKLAKKSKFEAFYYSLSFHISRVFAYVLLGFIAGYFGSIFAFSSQIMGYVKFAIGLFLVVLGVALIKRGELLKFIENDKIWKKFFAKPTKFAMQESSFGSFVLLGFLNGFLPCGVVYTFLAMAIMSGSAIKGAFIMVIFGISTIPSMLGLSFVTNLLNLKLKQIMLYISAILIIAFGIYNAYLGFEATNG